MDTTDRAVQALIDDGWIGDWDDPVDETHLTHAVSLVLRVVREDLVAAMERAWPDSMGQWTADQADAARSMKERALEIVRQVGADAKPEPTVALVTVDDRGHLTPDSTVTVGDEVWPVPEFARQGGVLWRARVFQVLKEHGFRPTRVNGQLAGIGESRPGVVGVRVEPIETQEG